MTWLRTAVAIGLMMAGLATTVPVQAAFIAESTTLGSWKTDGPVTIGDKVFTYVNSDLNPNLPVTFALVGVEYSATVSFGGVQSGPFSGYLNYTVAITDPSKSFASIRLDSTHLGDGVTVTKSEKNGAFDNLVSAEGSREEIGTNYSTQFLDVTDTIVVGPNGAIRDMTNGYTQTPEPATFVVWGGVMGIGYLFLRRRRTSAGVAA